MKTRIAILHLIAIALLGIATTAQAAGIIVTNGHDSGAGSLRQAISDAPSGGTISFAAGIATITLTSGELSISKSLIINGPGANLLSVQRSTASGVPAFRIFNLPSNIFAVTLSGLTITSDDGGGISNSGTLTIANDTLSGNRADAYASGGGILNYGTLTITNSTLSGNSAFIGGGIYNSNGTLTITNSTISGNTTTNTGYFGGGGIFNIGTLTAINTTIYGNSATSQGGGIYSYASTTTVINTTICGNSAGSYGGGIAVNSGSVYAGNTIIAKNAAPTDGPDVSGALTSQGHNLIGNNSGATIAPATGDQIGASGFPIDPMLGPLQDNGGPTRTQALLFDSPAIDAGKNGGSGTDQRGYARPVDLPRSNASGGDGNDVGAYEVQANDPPGCNIANSVVKNTNGSGADSLRDVIANVCTGTTITFAANVAGAINMTGPEILIDKSLAIKGPGANRLSVQRSASASTNFRIFDIDAASNVTISGLKIANGNSAVDGGGILNAGTLTIDQDVVTGNIATLGAGIWNEGNLIVHNSSIVSNVASAGGGGVGNRSGGQVRVVASTIASNTASYGGGLVNYGNLVAINSTIAANEAITNGGGLFNSGSSGTATANIYNSTIAYNDADFNRSSAYSGGGVFIEAGSAAFNLRNTLVAGNTVEDTPLSDDCTGAVSSYARNLFGTTGGCQITIVSGQWDYLNSIGLGGLQDNGGLTQTIALQAGSNAIDGAVYGPCVDNQSATIGIDQRGFARSVGVCDIGAYEAGARAADTIFANGFD